MEERKTRDGWKWTVFPLGDETYEKTICKGDFGTVGIHIQERASGDVEVQTSLHEMPLRMMVPVPTIPYELVSFKGVSDARQFARSKRRQFNLVRCGRGQMLPAVLGVRR